MADTVILAETTLDQFVFNDVFSRYFTFDEKVFSLKAGETYRVVWNGVEYSCTAQDISAAVGQTMIAIGNCSALGLAGNDEPFIICSDDTLNYYYLSDPDVTPGTYTVAIYQESAGVGIIQYDRNGNPMVFYGKKSLRVDTTDGGTRDFLSATLVEKTVELDFSGGDMTVEPGNEQLFEKVKIKTPATLIPENIAEGVDIAGVIGALAAGGGAKFACGSVTGTAAKQTITHNLGVTPDLVVFFHVGIYSANTSSVRHIGTYVGLSTAMQTAIGTTSWGRQAATVLYSSKCSTAYGSKGIEGTGGIVSNANATTFDVGSADGYLGQIPYNWYAIGGLT